MGTESVLRVPLFYLTLYSCSSAVKGNFFQSLSNSAVTSLKVNTGTTSSLLKLNQYYTTLHFKTLSKLFCDLCNFCTLFSNLISNLTLLFLCSCTLVVGWLAESLLPSLGAPFPPDLYCMYNILLLLVLLCQDWIWSFRKSRPKSSK